MLTVSTKPTAKTDEDPEAENSKATKSLFESLVMQNLPGWTAVWDMLVEEGQEKRKKHPIGKTKPADLQKRIRRKISELVNEEEMLVGLYKKAAEVSKKKEEEFKGKTATLIRQIEKDKHLLKKLKHMN